jgi:hypothetical protein
MMPSPVKRSGTTTNGTLAACSTEMVCGGPEPSSASTSDGFNPSTPSGDSARI